MYDANIYEIINMYIDGVKKDRRDGQAGRPAADRNKIRDYMAQLKGFEGLGGPIGFNADGDAIKAFYIVQGQNGAWETKCAAARRLPGMPAAERPLCHAGAVALAAGAPCHPRIQLNWRTEKCCCSNSSTV